MSEVLKRKEMEMPGLETIVGLVGEPPKEIKISIKTQAAQQRLMQAWNEVFIAIIPTCFKCKESLVWHMYPEGEILFHCPKCNRQWIKDEDWTKKEKKDDNTRRHGQQRKKSAGGTSKPDVRPSSGKKNSATKKG